MECKFYYEHKGNEHKKQVDTFRECLTTQLRKDETTNTTTLADDVYIDHITARMWLWLHIESAVKNKRLEAFIQEDLHHHKEHETWNMLNMVLLDIPAMYDTNTESDKQYRLLTPVQWFHVRNFLVWRLSIEAALLYIDMGGNTLPIMSVFGSGYHQWALWLDLAIKLTVMPVRLQVSVNLRVPGASAQDYLGVAHLSCHVNRELYITVAADKTGKKDVLPVSIGVGGTINYILGTYLARRLETPTDGRVFVWNQVQRRPSDTTISQKILGYIHDLFPIETYKTLIPRQHVIRTISLNAVGVMTSFDRLEMQKAGLFSRNSLDKIENYYTWWANLGKYAGVDASRKLLSIYAPRHRSTWVDAQCDSVMDSMPTFVPTTGTVSLSTCTSCAVPFSTVIRGQGGRWYMSCSHVAATGHMQRLNYDPISDVPVTIWNDVYDRTIATNHLPRDSVSRFKLPHPTVRQPTVDWYVGIDVSPSCIAMCVARAHDCRVRTHRIQFTRHLTFTFWYTGKNSGKKKPSKSPVVTAHYNVSPDNITQLCIQHVQKVCDESKTPNVLICIEAPPPTSTRRASAQSQFVTRFIHNVQTAVTKSTTVIITSMPENARRHFMNAVVGEHDPVHDHDVAVATRDRYMITMRQKNVPLLKQLLYVGYLLHQPTGKSALFTLGNMATTWQALDDDQDTDMHPHMDLVDSYVMAYHAFKDDVYRPLPDSMTWLVVPVMSPTDQFSIGERLRDGSIHWWYNNNNANERNMSYYPGWLVGDKEDIMYEPSMTVGQVAYTSSYDSLHISPYDYDEVSISPGDTLPKGVYQRWVDRRKMYLDLFEKEDAWLHSWLGLRPEVKTINREEHIPLTLYHKLKKHGHPKRYRQVLSL